MRALGPFAALLVPATLLAAAAIVLAFWPCSGRSCIESSLGAWVLVLFALPTALPAGLPWFVNALTVGLALLSSAALWMTLGAIAARRAARQYDGGWATFTKELLTLSGGVIFGVLLGFALIALWLRI
jgi:hypothetical protein